MGLPEAPGAPEPHVVRDEAVEKERPAATNPAVPVAKCRTSLKSRPVVARSLAAPVARCSPRVEGRQILSRALSLSRA